MVINDSSRSPPHGARAGQGARPRWEKLARSQGGDGLAGSQHRLQNQSLALLDLETTVSEEGGVCEMNVVAGGCRRREMHREAGNRNRSAGRSGGHGALNAVEVFHLDF